MLKRIRSPAGVWMRATSVILPSAGETTRPASAGTGRLGSRKNQRKKHASRKGTTAQIQLPGYQQDQNGSRDKPKTIKISVTHHVCDQTLGEL